MQLEFAQRTHMGHVRKINQDAIWSWSERGVFLVADGMGGEAAGDEAAAQVVTTIKRESRRMLNGSTPQTPEEQERILTRMVTDANREVCEIAVREPSKHGLGSTGSLLVLRHNIYQIAQVGDSRVYRLRHGRLEQLTRDHTLVWSFYEQGMIAYEELETHPQRHLLTQCIGNTMDTHVDTMEDSVEPGDLFLVCSDGLTGYTSHATLEMILNDEVGDLNEKADRMIAAALAGGGGDNVSVVLVRVAELAASDEAWSPRAGHSAPRPIEGHITTVANEDAWDERLRDTVQPAPNGRMALVMGLVCVVLLLGLGVAWLTGGRDPAPAAQAPLQPPAEVSVEAAPAQASD